MRPAHRRTHPLAFLALAALTAGCATVSRPPVTMAQLVAQSDTFDREEGARRAAIVDQLARRAARRGDATLDILLLSGGGQHGAFGAGFLRGWQERTDTPLPVFDLVTGVSTGALQSPYALVGTRASLDALGELYRAAADKVAPSVDWLAVLKLRRTGGIVDVSRLRSTVATFVNDTLRANVARARAEGRQLVVTSTDLDLGRQRTWNLTEELERPDGLQRMRDALVASSAIPGAFPPIVIDGRVHADGGSVGNVAPILDLDGFRRLGARLRAEGETTPVRVRTWAIMNVWTVPAPQVTDPASRKAVGQRGNIMFFWAQQRTLLGRLDELVHAVRAEVPNVRLEVHHVAIPDSLATDPAANKLFDKTWMLRLDSLGLARARSSRPWDAPISEVPTGDVRAGPSAAPR